MALTRLAQSDFAAGSVTSVARHLIPENGVYKAINLAVDDDGSVYRRGGSEYLSTVAFGSAGLRFVWDGHLAAGQRTLFANPDDFGVLDGANAPVNLGGPGLAGPVSAVELGGYVFVGGGHVYAGSLKAADYSTGTVTTTNGSAVVTGAGTAWSANVDAGMLLTIGTERPYAVATVDSNTQITLRDPYEGTTAAGKAYSLVRIATAQGLVSSSLYAVAANRLWTLDGRNRMRFSARDRPFSFAADDYHQLPEAAQILGGRGIRDVLLVFTSNGMWLVSNIVFDLTDDLGNVQHRLQFSNPELVVWSNEGIATWDDRVAVPCTDGVWLIDGYSRPVKLSLSVTPTYVAHVRAGRKTGGGAVYKAHYFLPVLDSANAVVDLLVCRLDRPVRTRLGTVFPWTFLADHGANVTGLAVRSEAGGARSPRLLAASRHSGSRVLDLSKLFEPQASVKNDADATTHQWELVTRDYPTGRFNRNLVKKLRAWYELVDAAADNPKISAFYSDGQARQAVTEWGLFDWGQADWAAADQAEFVQATGQAPEDTGQNPFTWLFRRRARFVRFKLRSTDPAARCTLRGIEAMVRQSTKDR